MTNEKSGNVRPALLTALVLLIGAYAAGYAANFVKYSSGSYWTDADEIVATTVTATTVTATALSVPDGVDAADIGTVAQSDTNATTTTTAYTPDFIGQVLVGNAGSTNYIWIAYGTTTNDWKVVHP